MASGIPVELEDHVRREPEDQGATLLSGNVQVGFERG